MLKLKSALSAIVLLSFTLLDSVYSQDTIEPTYSQDIIEPIIINFSYEDYVVLVDRRKIINFIEQRGAIATNIIHLGGRVYGVSFYHLSSEYSDSTKYDYSTEPKPSKSSFDDYYNRLVEEKKKEILEEREKARIEKERIRIAAEKRKALKIQRLKVEKDFIEFAKNMLTDSLFLYTLFEKTFDLKAETVPNYPIEEFELINIDNYDINKVKEFIWNKHPDRQNRWINNNWYSIHPNQTHHILRLSNNDYPEILHIPFIFVNKLNGDKIKGSFEMVTTRPILTKKDYLEKTIKLKIRKNEDSPAFGVWSLSSDESFIPNRYSENIFSKKEFYLAYSNPLVVDKNKKGWEYTLENILTKSRECDCNLGYVRKGRNAGKWYFFFKNEEDFAEKETPYRAKIKELTDTPPTKSNFTRDNFYFEKEHRLAVNKLGMDIEWMDENKGKNWHIEEQMNRVTENNPELLDSDFVRKNFTNPYDYISELQHLGFNIERKYTNPKEDGYIIYERFDDKWHGSVGVIIYKNKSKWKFGNSSSEWKSKF